MFIRLFLSLLDLSVYTNYKFLLNIDDEKIASDNSKIFFTYLLDRLMVKKDMKEELVFLNIIFLIFLKF
jgi:hypothetical protein